MTTLIGKYVYYHASGLPQRGSIIAHAKDDAVPTVIVEKDNGTLFSCAADLLIFDDEAAIASCLRYIAIWQFEMKRLEEGQ